VADPTSNYSLLGTAIIISRAVASSLAGPWFWLHHYRKKNFTRDRDTLIGVSAAYSSRTVSTDFTVFSISDVFHP